jgi:spore maturation protein CgeB
MGVEKTIDFGFCGNFCNREPVLRWLKKDHNLHLDIFVIGDKMVETINSYKCHFNLSVGNDMNYRSFETLGCKTLLMTNGNHQYDKLGFVDGENCLLYENTEDIKDKINQFREMSDDEINNVASKGHEFVKYHTITKRVEKLLVDLNVS